MVWGKSKNPGYSYFGTNVTLEGRLCFTGMIRLDGRVNGDIISTGSLIVEETAVVTGNIVVETLVLSGTVYGNIVAFKHVQLNGISKVYGHISYGELSIEGALHEGSSHKLTAEEIEDAKRDCLKLMEEAAGGVDRSKPGDDILERYANSVVGLAREQTSLLLGRRPEIETLNRPGLPPAAPLARPESFSAQNEAAMAARSGEGINKAARPANVDRAGARPAGGARPANAARPAPAAARPAPVARPANAARPAAGGSEENAGASGAARPLGENAGGGVRPAGAPRQANSESSGNSRPARPAGGGENAGANGSKPAGAAARQAGGGEEAGGHEARPSGEVRQAGGAEETGQAANTPGNGTGPANAPRPPAGDENSGHGGGARPNGAARAANGESADGEAAKAAGAPRPGNGENSGGSVAPKPAAKPAPEGEASNKKAPAQVKNLEGARKPGPRSEAVAEPDEVPLAEAANVGEA